MSEHVTWYGDDPAPSKDYLRQVAINGRRLKYAFGAAALLILLSLFAPVVSPRYYLLSIRFDVIPLACVLISLLIAVRVVVTGAWHQKLMALPILILIGPLLLAATESIANNYYGGWFVRILGP